MSTKLLCILFSMLTLIFICYFQFLFENILIKIAFVSIGIVLLVFQLCCLVAVINNRID